MRAEQSLDRTRHTTLGESHFKQEPPRFLGELLERLDDRPIVLVLELPRAMNEEIQGFLDTGSDQALAATLEKHDGLPLHDILRWAHAHREHLGALTPVASG